MDWIEALSIAAHDGVDFTATWFGAGPELDVAREQIKQLGLASKVAFPGPLDLPHLMRELRTFDAFVFCRKTCKSPRCLIEALICGLPIIGYNSSYARNLIRARRRDARPHSRSPQPRAFALCNSGQGHAIKSEPTRRDRWSEIHR